MNYKRTVDSTTEPVTLTEAKAFLEIDHSDRDTLITSLIKAARKWCENYMQRSIFTQTWALTMDILPGTDVIELLRGPVQSIVTFKYYDSANSLQTWTDDNSNFRLDISGDIARIQSVNGWPTVYDRKGAIEITYLAGEDTATAISEDIEHAIKMKVSDMYEIRQNTIIGSQVNLIEQGSKDLLDPYKIYYAFK